METLILISCALLGLAFVTLAKLQAIRNDFKDANQPFVYRKFFEKEMMGIAMSVIVIILGAVTMQEWIGVKPGLENYTRIIFAGIGALGSWAALLILGKSKKYIRGIVDRKTNIADGLTDDTEQDSNQKSE